MYNFFFITLPYMSIEVQAYFVTHHVIATVCVFNWGRGHLFVVEIISLVKPAYDRWNVAGSLKAGQSFLYSQSPHIGHVLSCS